jgi:hypothetical protein
MLGALLIMGCTPLSLIFGIIGIVVDTTKWLAILITVITSLFFAYTIGAPVVFSLCS